MENNDVITMMIVKIITIILSGFVGYLIGRLVYKILNDK
jgi:hypothetical protein